MKGGWGKRFEHEDSITPQVEFWGEQAGGLIHTLHIEAKEFTYFRG